MRAIIITGASRRTALPFHRRQARSLLDVCRILWFAETGRLHEQSSSQSGDAAARDCCGLLSASCNQVRNFVHPL